MRRSTGVRSKSDGARSSSGVANSRTSRGAASLPLRPLPAASLARRVLWVIALCVWVFALLAMVSFDAADWPSHEVALHRDPPANFGGWAGAMFAYQVHLVFGLGSWIVLFALGGSLLVTATGRRVDHPIVRGVGVLLAAASFAGLHALFAPQHGGLTGVAPGLVGMAAKTELSARFGAVMVAAILCAGLLVGSVTAADRLVLALPGALLRGLRGARHALSNVAASLRPFNPLPLLRWIGARIGRSDPSPATVSGLRGVPVADGLGDLDGVTDADLGPGNPDNPDMASSTRPSQRFVHPYDGAPDFVTDPLDDGAPLGCDSSTLALGAEEDVRSRRTRGGAKGGANVTPPSPTAEDVDLDGESIASQDTDDALAGPVESQDSASGDSDTAADAATRQRLSADELRAKIAKLPVRMTGRNKPAAPDDDTIVRSPADETNLEGYRFPTLELLEVPETNYSEKMEAFVRQQAQVLEEALQTYSIDAEVVGIESGPVVTLFSVQLAPGTRVARLQAISTDIARSLQAHNIRILPNTAGKTTVGIEVPNLQKEKVRLKELMSGGHADGMSLPMFLGKDASGEPLVADLTRMPHMLIAGTTGSGKSVCMNSIIMSWLYTKRPDELKVVLVDPKMVEMSQFADIPHLMCPVVTEMSRAAAILEWAVTKMEERYELLREAAVRDIGSYNSLTEEELYERFEPQNDLERAKIPKKLPFLVFVIDELADLMMTNKEVEHSIVRIAQKARAVGIHLILATQRPQANVVTGLIKSNMPCRVSFKVASGMDSRIVLDSKGAELLLGQGDMLFLNPKTSEIRRAQGTLVTDGEIRRVTKFLKEIAAPSFERSLMTIRVSTGESTSGGEGGLDEGDRDPMFDQAVEVMIESGRGSVSLLQRRLAIGYSRASRLVDQMGLAGILGEHKGSVAREVMITLDEWRQMKTMEEQQEREGTVFEEAEAGDDAEASRGESGIRN